MQRSSVQGTLLPQDAVFQMEAQACGPQDTLPQPCAGLENLFPQRGSKTAGNSCPPWP